MGYYRFEQVTCVLTRVTYAMCCGIVIRDIFASDDKVSFPFTNSVNILTQKGDLAVNQL
jgi:hypothetical protein